ncbi:hypothetical protein Tco_1347710, partial [Tanacetum coccineum]
MADLISDLGPDVFICFTTQTVTGLMADLPKLDEGLYFRDQRKANKARFGRPPLNGNDRHLGGFKEPNVRPTNGNKETRNNSFASVLKSNQPNNLSSSNMIHDASPAIALDDDCLSANDLSCVAIGKIKDINTLSNLSVILNDEGFDDIKISYLGGYWVLIQSKSCASKEKLINHAGVLNWFHELGNANNSFVSDIRLVWIAIEGLPMCAWNNKALSKIVSPWGTLTPVDLVEDSSLPYRKVCVTTKVDDLECDVTFDEIKKAVWDCGTNKSPGPDGFSFDFIRTFWDILKHDFVNAIREFFISSKFPPGCNSSFIALIPKKHDAKFVKDYRPISLIGCFYKIVYKILANRLK